MSDSWDWADSNVLVDEVIGCEVDEGIVWLYGIIVSTFSQGCQLIDCDLLHSLKYFDKIIWLLLQLRVVSESMELTVNSSCPTCNLVIYNVHLLEFILKLIVVFCLVLNLLLHLQNVFILELNIFFLSSSCICFRINFKIMKSISEHFVVLFQNVKFLITIANIL